MTDRLPSVTSTPSRYQSVDDLRLMAKIGSIVVHVEELWSYQPPVSETADVLATRMLLRDPDVKAWLAELQGMALVPAKRSKLEQDEQFIGMPLTPSEVAEVERERRRVGWAVSLSDTAEEVLPTSRPWRKGDKCPVCGNSAGRIGMGHQPGCIIGGRAE